MTGANDVDAARGRQARVRLSRADHGKLSPALQLATFRRDGFLRFEQLISAEAVAALVQVYDGMLTGRINCVDTDRKLGGAIRQIMEPHLYHPIFLANPALEAGCAAARVALGCEAPRVALQMLIYKEPGQVADTPLHQDFAYLGTPFAPAGTEVPSQASVMFWIALDDVDPANGCMHFLPGGHLEPLLPHYVALGAPDDPGRLLAVRDGDRILEQKTAVACPLPAGGATMHSFGTPHYTTGNRTPDRPRRAYIFNFVHPDRWLDRQKHDETTPPFSR